MPDSPDHKPILTIMTSKNWVLPPRPKNIRKSKSSSEKKKPKPRSCKPQTPVPAPNKPSQASQVISEKSRLSSPMKTGNEVTSTLDSPEQLATNIKLIDCENYQLKTKLLSLIHDYKSLKALVTSPSSDQAPPVDVYDTSTTARKRVYPEMSDPMNDLIQDMSGLSHASPHSMASPADEELNESGFETELFSFINLEQDSLYHIGEEFEAELHDEDEDDDVDSASLSRSLSPPSDFDENSLMTTLTRSTTVSTTNSLSEKKPFAQHFKFHDLPEFSEEDYVFSFEKELSHEKMMSVIEEDQYNQVADFLEEKLMSNEVQYYVEKSNST